MDDKITDIIIWKYLNGELTPSQEKEVQTWYNISSANQILFNEIRLLWLTSIENENIELNEKADLDYITEKIEKSLLSDKNENNFSFWKKPWIRYAGSAAAILAILYTITISVVYWTKDKSDLYTEVSTQRGKQSEIILADGTHVWLNSESTIKYPTNINDKDVQIYLEGEAYFNVSKLKGRDFTVNAGDINITVQGTSFNVKAYPEESSVEATLEEGKITVTSDNSKKSFIKPIIMKPNQRLVVDLNNTSCELINLQNNNTSNYIGSSIPSNKSGYKETTNLYTSWKDGKLQFKNMRFEDLEKEMERWFNVTIVLNDPVLKNARYTGVFENESIETVLKALSLSLPFKYTMNPDSLIIEPINQQTN